MGANSEVIVFPPGIPGKILKWKVREGTFVPAGRVLLLYDVKLKEGQEEPKKFKAPQMGMVKKLLAREGETINPGTALLELEECTHPTVMNAMCAECGADLRTENQTCLKASVPMVHCIPELKVSREQAEIIGKADEERLLTERKLVLLVDLDQTLIHTTNDHIPPNIRDVYHFQLYGPASPWYHTRIRPGTKNFLKEMSQIYELHICTFGARNYAHMIAMFLDPDGKYFSHRILSRDECFNFNSKTANLSALFPCGDHLVCIIDDREDVWNFAPNLIHVKPYHFFRHTGDINAPPGVTKYENDEKEGFVFGNMGKKTRIPAEKNADKQITKGAVKSRKEARGDSKAGAECAQVSEGKDAKEVIRQDGVKSIAVAAENGESAEGQVKKEGDAAISIESTTKVKESSRREEVIKGGGGKVKENLICSEEKVSTEEAVAGDTLKAETETKADVFVTEKEQKPEDGESNCTNPVDKESSTMEVCASTEALQIDAAKSVCTEGNSTSKTGKEGMLVERELDVNDRDDYLLYLEGVLKTIHSAFYQLYDELKGDVPDLKNVIPYVRRKVLAGTRLVFSGLVPTHISLEKSRVYQVARSLGAIVTADIDSNTTHLVAVRPGTAKVITARRMKNIVIVTPEWLWCCAERWEHVNEQLFPLGRGQLSRRHPPSHCGSPEYCPMQQTVKSNARFIDSINPLMSFSPEDIEKMDREVDDIFNESESDGEGEETEKESQEEIMRRAVLEYHSSSSSSSPDSLSGEHPHGWGPVMSERRKRTMTDSELDDFDEDMPSTKFRRGEALPSDLELGEDESASNGSEEPPDEIDDGDWNMMGAALEREFLSD